jgi:hypothetical protein
VGVVVGEGAQAVEFFLAGRVPEGELDVDVVDEDVVDVVFEDGGFAAEMERLGFCDRGWEEEEWRERLTIRWGSIRA